MYSTIWLILAIVYIILAFGFGAAIQFERLKQDADFSAFQVLVAIFWPIWVIWYISVLIKEKFQKWKSNTNTAT